MLHLLIAFRESETNKRQADNAKNIDVMPIFN